MHRIASEAMHTRQALLIAAAHPPREDRSPTTTPNFTARRRNDREHEQLIGGTRQGAHRPPRVRCFKRKNPSCRSAGGKTQVPECASTPKEALTAATSATTNGPLNAEGSVCGATKKTGITAPKWWYL